MDNSKRKTPVTLSIALVLVLCAAVLIYFYYSQQVASLTKTNQDLSAKAAQYDAIIEKQTAADEAQRALFKITWPTSNTSLCYENQYSVSWQTPSDMDIVKADLITPNSDVDLGQFPAINSNGTGVSYGSFSWDLTDANGQIIPPG